MDKGVREKEIALLKILLFMRTLSVTLFCEILNCEFQHFRFLLRKPEIALFDNSPFYENSLSKYLLRNSELRISTFPFSFEKAGNALLIILFFYENSLSNSLLRNSELRISTFPLSFEKAGN